MTNRPTFINIGPGRCGTSWLFEVLNEHPDILMARVKETEFFNTNYVKGMPWYEDHFPDGSARAIGEISNNYYLDPQVADRIKSYDPNLKLIMNVRDPRDLLESHYAYGVRRGIDLPPLNEALDVPIGRIMGSGFDHRLSTDSLTAADRVPLFEAILLSERLSPFLASFKPSQIYVLIYERIESDAEALVCEIYGFLGVDPTFRPRMLRRIVNPSIAPRSQVAARLASRLAFALRTVGAYGLLTRLHHADWIKRVLYSQRATEPAHSASRQTRLDAPYRAKLDRERYTMKKLHPALARWWNA